MTSNKSENNNKNQMLPNIWLYNCTVSFNRYNYIFLYITHKMIKLLKTNL